MPAGTDDEISRIYRSEWGRILATLIRRTGDFALAEEATQDAFEAAVVAFREGGLPEQPRAWLLETARNKAIDRLRRRRTLEGKLDLLASTLETSAAPATGADIPDDRLRLIFTCCHPALALETQVALTLRTLIGLDTEEIARALVVPVSAMAQRLVRARHKIAAARIPYDVPEAREMPERLHAVLTVLYLVFTEGYAATRGELVRADLSGEAIRLTRVVRALSGPEPPREVTGLLALMLLHDSRRDARTDESGDLVLLEDQDRSRWARSAIDEALPLAFEAMVAEPGPFALQAAIAAVHARAASAEETDWAEIARLYEKLGRLDPSPVVALNRAVAVAMAEGPARGLALIDAIEREGALRGYHLLHAARADLSRRLGDVAAARASYRLALELVTNDAERRFLERRLREVGR